MIQCYIALQRPGISSFPLGTALVMFCFFAVQRDCITPYRDADISLVRAPSFSYLCQQECMGSASYFKPNMFCVRMGSTETD